MFLLDTPNRTADFRGQVLDPDLYTWMRRICDLAGLQMGKDCFISYAVKCGGQFNGKPKAKEVKACQTYLWAEIDAVKPEYVICMGAAAIKAIWGKAAKPLKLLRGRVKQAGIRLKDAGGGRITPFILSATYSPRILAESPQLVTVLADDISVILGKITRTSVNRRYTTNRPDLLERELYEDVR